jgi:hypothetical protein
MAHMESKDEPSIPAEQHSGVRADTEPEIETCERVVGEHSTCVDDNKQDSPGKRTKPAQQDHGPNKKCKFDRRQWGNTKIGDKGSSDGKDERNSGGSSHNKGVMEGEDREENSGSGKVKKNVVVLVGYVGSGYCGLQKYAQTLAPCLQ